MNDQPNVWPLEDLREIDRDLNIGTGSYADFMFAINRRVTNTLISRDNLEIQVHYVGRYQVGYGGRDYEVYLSELTDNSYDDKKLGYFEFSTWKPEHSDKWTPIIRIILRNFKSLSKILDEELISYRIFNSSTELFLQIEIDLDFLTSYHAEFTHSEPQQLLDLEIPITRIKIRHEISLQNS